MRILSTEFKTALKSGILKPVLDLVTADNTLDLQIRGEHEVNVYYRGGSILRIKRENDEMIFSFDKEYLQSKIDLPKRGEVAEWVKLIPLLKNEMDHYFTEKREKNEREYQQLIIRENNCSNIANGTDYFILDQEYNEGNARFDLIAVEWESTVSIRKLSKNYLPKLAVIEIKYGDGALSGSAGMEKHIEDFKSFVDSDKIVDLKKEMILNLKQKRELGLINSLSHNPNEINNFAGEVDFIFILINHDPDSSKLNKILENIEKLKDINFNMLFAASNFMGYGLYKQNFYNLKEFKERFCKQIYYK